MHAHGVDIFDRTNNHAVVGVIAHDFEFVFFPSGDRLLNENFGDGAGLKSVGRNLFELLHV